MNSRWEHGHEVERYVREMRMIGGSDVRYDIICLMSDGCVVSRVGGGKYKVKWAKGKHTRPQSRWNVPPHFESYKPYLRRCGYIEIAPKK